METTSRPGAADQSRIWRHFQNEAPASFAVGRPRLDFLARQVARRARPAARVLNIGSGDGYLERRLLAGGFEVHALDPDATTVARLWEAGITAVAGRIERIPAADGAFDVVVASEVLEHLGEAERRAGVAEVARVLGPGGWFLGTVPLREDLAANEVVCPACGEVFHRWGHRTSFDMAGLRAELAAALEVRTARRATYVRFPFRGRPLSGKLKAAILTVLAAVGVPLAEAKIFFEARPQRGGAGR